MLQVTFRLGFQKELFGAGETGQPDGVSSRKMSNGSTGSTKHKWLKAFKSLKTSSPTTPPSADKSVDISMRMDFRLNEEWTRTHLSLFRFTFVFYSSHGFFSFLSLFFF